MIGLWKGFAVASGLAGFLRAEIDRRGWSASQLASKAGISRSTITKIFDRPEAIPRLDTLYGLAQALDVPLERLIRICGFEPGEDDGMLDMERQALLRDAIPELGSVVDEMSQMTPAQQQAVLAYIAGLRDQESQS
jgi:transcriptional regulator with XRE-family HTH domain